jgi:hypothetical protein
MAGNFSRGLAPVKIGKRWGYVDTSGAVAIEPVFLAASPFAANGLARVLDGSSLFSAKYGFINEKGQWAIEPRFGEVGNFKEGLASVRCDAGYGFIDSSGKVVIAVEYGKCFDFSEGLAVIAVPGDGGIAHWRWKAETEEREYDCGRLRLVLLRTSEADEGAVSHGYILPLLNGMVQIPV